MKATFRLAAAALAATATAFAVRPLQAGVAAPGGTPRAIADDALARAFAVLRDPELAGGAHREQRRARLREITDEVFDWSEMARRSLGVRWRNATPKERERFVDAFQQLLAERYLTDIDTARGNEKYTIDRVSQDTTDARVDTTLITHSRERIEVSYFFHLGENGVWRVHDVSIEGVDLVDHYRGVFDRLLVNGTLDQLIQRLEEKRTLGQ
jgi:phospholipid transport system substrate-binding protein